MLCYQATAKTSKGLNWPLALSFLHHTLEEIVEVIRELPRKEWKDQEVNPNRVLEEMADVYIQFLTALFYTGFTKEDLDLALYFKLSQTKNRKDWKDSEWLVPTILRLSELVLN